jgi:hypothetical protein
MRKLSILWLLAALFAVPMSGQNGIVHVYADQKNQVHVVYKNRHAAAVAGEPDQVGIDSVKISKDGQTAGWLALYPDPDSSTPFAGTLVLWRGGKVVRRFQADQTFWSWDFYAGATQVAYHVGPTHGEALRSELHDIESGRLLAAWDGDLDDANRPEWTRGLDH